MAEDTPHFDVEEDLFSFETDHLALKGNKDYCEVLKTLVILTAQRERALKDYKKVSELREECLKDPFETLDKIKNGSNLGVPPIHELPKLPVIDLKKYNVNVSQRDLKEIYSDSIANEDEKILEDVKPTNSNQKAWSTEEQKRLEELLQIYPPEPIEQRRFQKIARALGNRTVNQVQSRVQKYFLKLYKAGLPIPGRIPKSVEKYRKSAHHRHQKNNHLLWKPTTFFPDLNVPVYMDTLNDVPGPSGTSNPSLSGSSVSSPSTTSNYLLQTDYVENVEMPVISEKKDDKELQLDLLKRIRREKASQCDEDFYHYGFKCDYCEEDPIIGTRWHCATCKESVDFCTDCVLSQMYSDSCHPLTHWLVVYREETPDIESSRLYNPINSTKNEQRTPSFNPSNNSSVTDFDKQKYGESSGISTKKEIAHDSGLKQDKIGNLELLLFNECDENSNSEKDILSD